VSFRFQLYYFVCFLLALPANTLITFQKTFEIQSSAKAGRGGVLKTQTSFKIYVFTSCVQTKGLIQFSCSSAKGHRGQINWEIHDVDFSIQNDNK